MKRLSIQRADGKWWSVNNEWGPLSQRKEYEELTELPRIVDGGKMVLGAQSARAYRVSYEGLEPGDMIARVMIV